MVQGSAKIESAEVAKFFASTTYDQVVIVKLRVLVPNDLVDGGLANAIEWVKARIDDLAATRVA
jgi:hypothetical protein